MHPVSGEKISTSLRS